MFGKFRSILDEFPNYILDYQEHGNHTSERRWEDRVTTDGSWSGNIFDFYRKIYKKLVEDLKIPFHLKEGLRIDETEVHEAIRESIVNSLIHADYNETTGILITKSPGVFRFRNPGKMRISITQARKGGISDCRNRNLQKMFQFVGVGEQAGSGIPQIFQTWKKQHWVTPLIEEHSVPNFTSFELKQLSLFSEEVIAGLNQIFGETKMKKTSELERIILGTAFMEKALNHRRISEITDKHPSDISKALRKLVRTNFLKSEGDGRGTSYEIFKRNSSEGLKESSEGLKESSEGLKESSEGLKESSEGLKESSEGLDTIPHDLRGVAAKLEEVSKQVRNKKKAPRNLVEDTIHKMCKIAPLTLGILSLFLGRNPDFIRQNYIKSMIDAKKIKPLHEDELTHPKQAYIGL